jgi:hypothetical protein
MSLEKLNDSEDQGVDGKTTSKFVSKKQDERVSNGLKWLRRRSSSACCEQGN